MSSEKTNFYVGVDLGGTKILAGVFDASLQLLGKMKLSTKGERGVKEVIQRIVRCAREAVDESDLKLAQIQAVGIGAPGAVDAKSGKVIFAPNLKWEDVPLQKELEKQLERPVFVENDCNVCALGVYEMELDCKPDSMVGIFIGTGVGGGLIFDRNLYSGFNLTAGEIGHMVIDMNGPKTTWGPRGTFESLASRTAIFNRIKESVKAGKKTALTEMLGDELDDLRSGDLRKAIKRGDKLVEEIVMDAAHCTGIAVGNVINLLNPQVVMLGGGVMEALGKVMIDSIRKTAFEHTLPGTTKGIEILVSKLGDLAGITGAGVLARRNS